MSRDARKPVFGDSDLVQHKLGYNHRKWLELWNFRFRKQEECTIYVAKTKALISCAITAQLIFVFVFPNMQKRGFLRTRLKYTCFVNTHMQVQYLPPPCCVLDQDTLLPGSIGNTQEAVAPSLKDWKIVYWYIKPQHKQINKRPCNIY